MTLEHITGSCSKTLVYTVNRQALSDAEHTWQVCWQVFLTAEHLAICMEHTTD